MRQAFAGSRPDPAGLRKQVERHVRPVANSLQTDASAPHHCPGVLLAHAIAG